ncbi:MAG: hypothetical protein FJ276_19830 [Planctomycetes bacterium]|nr:hypothetical protein [Planctomycetota bacterium]
MKPITINTLLALVATCWGASFARSAEAEAKHRWRWDCGTADSPVMPGYRRLTAADQYDEQRGYGWETPRAIDKVFPQPTVDRTLQGSAGQEIMFAYATSCRTDLTTDGVVSETDLVFRLDVPDGKYRVVLTVGDMSQAIGSMDVKINNQLVVPHLAVWGRGNYRMFIQNPGPWWRTIRATADAREGALRIVLSKNQSYYDTELARQAQWETPYARWYHRTPIIQKPPYVFIGAPFVHNSLMAIEVSPHVPPPLMGDHDRDSIELTLAIDSPALNEAVACYNRGDFSRAIRTLDQVREPDAAVAKALLQLWVAGRLETESERALVPAAVETLRDHVGRHPHDLAVADILTDAEIYLRAWDYHATRGQLGKNHFNENNKAINWWLLIGRDSPLYYKSQLHLVRAARMLVPYFPTIATEEAIFKVLEAKCPDNRFVRYHLYQEWENTGDGSGYYDWVMEDYASKAQDAPPWVQAIYPAYAGLVDLSEWWIRFRQEPEGTIGGGWGDDVEMVGLFGYYGYISRDASELCLQGASKLVDGVWNLSEVDPERGYCAPIADAEHTAEWTGNTLGMMMQIDYGNPIWIERSMKTGKLIRDLWTGIDDRGRRHFRSNFFGASAVGAGDQANDSREVRNLTATFYRGDPKLGGAKIGSRTIDRLEAPIDLEPRVHTVMVPHVIEGDPQDIHVVLDAENTIRDEITDFNNVAHALLPRPHVESPTRKKTGGSMRRGR